MKTAVEVRTTHRHPSAGLMDKPRRNRSRIQLGEVGMSPRTRSVLENNKQAIEDAEKSMRRHNPLFNR